MKLKIVMQRTYELAGVHAYPLFFNRAIEVYFDIILEPKKSKTAPFLSKYTTICTECLLLVLVHAPRDKIEIVYFVFTS